MCAIGKSPRTTKDKDLIKWGETTSKVKIEIKKEYYENTIEIITREKEKKTIKINDIPRNAKRNENPPIIPETS